MAFWRSWTTTSRLSPSSSPWRAPITATLESGWWHNLFDVFPDFAVEVVEVRDSRDETLATLRNRGQGSSSGTPFEESLWMVARWRRGKCFWWQAFGDKDKALEAAGLRE